MFEVFYQKQNRQLLKLNFSLIFPKLLYSDTSIAPSLKLKSLSIPNRLRNRKPFVKHFIENLFLNKVQVSVLEYPEIETLKEVDSLFKHCDTTKALVESSHTVSKEALFTNEPDKSFWSLKNLGLTGFKVPVSKGGFGFENSEYTYMQEVLSVDLGLSKFVSKNEDFGISLIKIIASDTLKEKYLPKLISGEELACFAHFEPQNFSSFDPISVNTSAKLTSDGCKYIVAGVKNWSYNASYANFIIFSANVIKNAENITKSKLGIFIVDKNLPGIKILKANKDIGLYDSDCCTVEFNNVEVPVDCLLSESDEVNESIKAVFTKCNVNHGAQCVTAIKKLIDAAIHNCLNKKIFGKYKFNRSFYQGDLGNVVACLYAVESMTYLVAGRMDIFENADLFLESLILKIVSSVSLQFALEHTLGIIGTEIYSEYSNILPIVDDSFLFNTCDFTNDYLKLILSKTGCNYVIQYQNENNFLEKFRDCLDKQNWSYFMSKITNSQNYLFCKKLRRYVHLMFEKETFLLEAMIFQLKTSTEFLLENYKRNMNEISLELKHLSDLVIYIYTTFAILGRASRAYCLGVRHQEVDAKIARFEIFRIFHEYQRIVKLITSSKSLKLVNNGDINFSNYEKLTKKYPTFVK